MKVPQEDAQSILREVESRPSPVGINAGHTRELILGKLLEIERRRQRIGSRSRKLA
jgi:hypothetical protein